MKTFKLVIAGGGSTYTPGIVKSLQGSALSCLRFP